MDLLITFIIILFSAIVHEVMHGVVAEKMGDDTARHEGRITLNPVPHIDPFMSLLLPALLLFAGSPIVFGAAKPVPVNFNNMRRPRLGMALVSLAGPGANFGLAIICAVLIKLGLVNSLALPIFGHVILINLILGTFNLVPIPPLDGSKILASLGSREWMYKILSLERYGFILVIAFLILGLFDKILIPVIQLFGNIFGFKFF